MTPAQLQTMAANINADAAELAALTADRAALIASNVDVNNLTAAQAFSYFVQAPNGPWTTILAVDPSTIKAYGAGDALPLDWPTADTSGTLRAEFVYRGAGVAVSALPFPLSSWTRAT